MAQQIWRAVAIERHLNARRPQVTIAGEGEREIRSALGQPFGQPRSGAVVLFARSVVPRTPDVAHIQAGR